MMHASWDLECDWHNFLSFGSFLPFYLTIDPKNLNSEKLQKKPGDIILLSMCTINEDHMIYGSKFWENEKKNMWRYYHFTLVYHKWQSHDVWFPRYGVQQTKFFAIFNYFLPFYPKTTQKIKISKKFKKTLAISSFYTNVPKIIIICLTLSEIWQAMDVIIFHLGLFFALTLPKSPKNQNF